MRFLTRPFVWIAHEIHVLAHTQKDQDIPILHGLRGISVLMIVLFHCTFAVLYLFKEQAFNLHRFIDSIPSLFAIILGFDKAVDLFFLLSAFLLTRSLRQEFLSAQSLNLKQFYRHRIARIYPVFLLALLLYAPWELSTFGSKLWFSLAFIDNFIPTRLIPVSWSLSVEMQFYAVLPFIVLGLERLGNLRRIIICLTLALIGSILIRGGLGLSLPESYRESVFNLLIDKGGRDYMMTLYYPTYARLSPLILGILWAYLHDSVKWQKRLQNLPRIWAQTACGIAFLVAYTALKYPAYQTASIGVFDSNWNLLFISLERFGFAFAAMTMMMLIYWSKGLSCLGQGLSWSIWRVIAHLSFPIFLFHFVFIIPAYAITFMNTDFSNIHEVAIIQVIVAFLLTAIMSILFSLPIHRYIEVPGIRWGHRKSGHR